VSALAKASGLGWTTLSADDSSGTPVVIKNDVTNLSFATPRGVQDITGVDKSAFERLLLLADFSVTLNGVYNTAVSHSVFKTVPSTSVNRTLSMTVNAVSLPNEVIFTDYPLTRAQSGELTWAVPGSLSDGTVPTWA
jgi:hypothetical protein